MPGYYARSVWYIGGSPDLLWSPLIEVEKWPQWWPQVRSAVELEPSLGMGQGSLKRCIWRGPIAPEFGFNLRITRLRKESLLEAEIRGHLEGTTRWELAPQAEGTAVQMEWSFHTNIWWMNLLAPFTRRIYPRVFDAILENGGHSLCNFLEVSLLPVNKVQIPKQRILC